MIVGIKEAAKFLKIGYVTIYKMRVLPEFPQAELKLVEGKVKPCWEEDKLLRVLKLLPKRGRPKKQN